MPSVKLSAAGGTGVLTYTSRKDKTVRMLLETKVDLIRERVEKYFSTKRTYLIPESPTIDDYRTDLNVIPTRSVMYFELALITLQAETGISVLWPRGGK